MTLAHAGCVGEDEEALAVGGVRLHPFGEVGADLLQAGGRRGGPGRDGVEAVRAGAAGGVGRGQGQVGLCAQATRQGAMIRVEVGGGVDQVLEAGGAVHEDEGVEVGLGFTRVQGQAQDAHGEPGILKAQPMADAPRLLGGEVERAVLDWAGAAVVGEDDRAYATSEQEGSPLVADVCEAGVGQGGHAEGTGPVCLGNGESLELALGEDDGIAVVQAIPAEGENRAALGVAAG